MRNGLQWVITEHTDLGPKEQYRHHITVDVIDAGVVRYRGQHWRVPSVDDAAYEWALDDAEVIRSSMARFEALHAENMTTRQLHNNVKTFGRDKRDARMVAIYAELDKRTRGGLDCGCGWGDYCEDHAGCECL